MVTLSQIIPADNRADALRAFQPAVDGCAVKDNRFFAFCVEAVKQLVQQFALVHAMVRADIEANYRHNGGKVKSIHGIALWS